MSMKVMAVSCRSHSGKPTRSDRGVQSRDSSRPLPGDVRFPRFLKCEGMQDSGTSFASRTIRTQKADLWRGRFSRSSGNR